MNTHLSNFHYKQQFCSRCLGWTGKSAIKELLSWWRDRHKQVNMCELPEKYGTEEEVGQGYRYKHINMIIKNFGSFS